MRAAGPVDLLRDPPARALLRLGLPIMASSLVQLAYSITDMIWIGRLGPQSVAAIGTGGLFLWMSEGICTIPRIGGQVTAGQSLGAGRGEEARRCARAALQAGLLSGLIFALLMYALHAPLVALFNFSQAATVAAAETYMRIAALGVLPSFVTRILTALLTASGESRLPFRLTALGLAANMLLDPLLIFPLGLGVAGAAWATVIAQTGVCLLFIRALRREALFVRLGLTKPLPAAYYGKILRIGFPAGVQSILYATASLLLARLIAAYGDAAVAVQRVGGQVETLSWMTAEGLSSAVNAYNAQNYGAGLWPRLHRGYRVALRLSLAVGALSTALFLLFPEAIMGVFFREAEVLAIGRDYLVILAYSQFFMIAEIVTTGAFAGYGETRIPSVLITLLTLGRVPAAYLLLRGGLGLNGIFWAISASSLLKAALLVPWFLLYQRRLEKADARHARTEPGARPG